MHIDSMYKVSENTFIPKQLIASKKPRYRFFSFSKKPRFWFFNGNRNSSIKFGNFSFYKYVHSIFAKQTYVNKISFSNFPSWHSFVKPESCDIGH